MTDRDAGQLRPGEWALLLFYGVAVLALLWILDGCYHRWRYGL